MATTHMTAKGGPTPADVVARIRDAGIRVVELRFTDLLGQWQHFSVPASQVDEGSFADGFGFDGSSIRGWKEINESDMLVLPDAGTAAVDPFYRTPTMVLTGNVLDPITKEEYLRDPRSVAQRAEHYLLATGIGDTAFFGPEAEFFVFDTVRYDNRAQSSYYHIDSEEGIWNSGREGDNRGYRPRSKGGYFPVPPADQFQDLRSEMMLTLEELGIAMECHHHEVATAGQGEIDMRFQSLVRMADQMQWFKYVVKNVAYRHGKTATFMPKPLVDDNGSGMHCHMSIWKNGTNLFAGDGYAGLSDTGKWAIGGILKHAPALAAFTNPTTNSYRRLVPGYEAPVNLAYSSRNRSAACRIPMYSASPKAKRVEVRFPDPSSNPYLAFAAMTMAGMDGIENKIDPGQPLDKNIYALSPEEAAGIPTMPGALDEALDNLEANHEFLLKGDVFTSDAIETWIAYKREAEVDAIRLRPHPHEFELYFDC